MPLDLTAVFIYILLSVWAPTAQAAYGNQILKKVNAFSPSSQQAILSELLRSSQQGQPSPGQLPVAGSANQPHGGATPPLFDVNRGLLPGFILDYINNFRGITPGNIGQ